MHLVEPIEQSGYKEVDDDDVKVSVVMSKKIIITIANVVPAGRKLLITSTKMILLEDG